MDAKLWVFVTGFPALLMLAYFILSRARRVNIADVFSLEAGMQDVTAYQEIGRQGAGASIVDFERTRGGDTGKPGRTCSWIDSETGDAVYDCCEWRMVNADGGNRTRLPEVAPIISEREVQVIGDVARRHLFTIFAFHKP